MEWGRYNVAALLNKFVVNDNYTLPLCNDISILYPTHYLEHSLTYFFDAYTLGIYVLIDQETGDANPPTPDVVELKLLP